VRLLRSAIAHVPGDPWRDGASALQSWADGGLAVGADGRVADLGDWAEVRSRFPDAPVDDRRGALVLPGLVDAHVHYPQVGVVGALGLRLLEWLEERTLPHEARFAAAAFARDEARTFLRLLARNGTTTALVFGAHFAVAMEAFFHEAAASGLRVAAGLCVADRGLRPDLLTTPEQAYEEAAFLARRWHGRGRLRYAVTPRFSLSSSPDLLDACAAVAREVPGALVTSHLNETPEEIAEVRVGFPTARDYLATYEAAGLVGPRSVFAHDLYPTDDELPRLAAAGAAVAHCPSSNLFLGSGSFPWRRHQASGVGVALGTDVGAGLGPSALHEASLAYLGQRLRGADGLALGAAQLLHLATAAGAAALGLAEEIGDLRPGRYADLVVVRPPPGSTLAAVWRHAGGVDALVGTAFMLAREESIESTWVAGVPVWDAIAPGGGAVRGAAGASAW
jgi:guanine deaminase